MAYSVLREIPSVETCVMYLEANVPESGYVSLIADGEAHKLYAQFGFVHTAPASVGMAFKRRPADAQ